MDSSYNMKTTDEKIVRSSTKIAIASFAIGTFLFASVTFRLFAPRHIFDLLVFGFIFVIGAFLTNLVVLLKLVALFNRSEPEEKEKLAVRMLIVLANLPIAMIYYEFLGFY